MNSLRALQGTTTISSGPPLLASQHDQSSEDATLTIDEHEPMEEMDTGDGHDMDDAANIANNVGTITRNQGADAFVDCEDDLNTFEGVAKQSRLPENDMSELEQSLFSDIINSPATVCKFVTFRNTILQLWYQNPQTQLVLEEILARISVTEPYLTLLKRIFFYLERHGLINFGIFRVIKFPFTGPPKKKVIIIGAGIAGLVAARQLKYFNFDVIVLESRKRIGGRVNTYRHGKYAVDVGAVMIPGIIGNPIRIINKQIDMKLKSFKQKCPLYHGRQGELLSKDKDDNIENLFNNMLEATKFIDENVEIAGKEGKPLSLNESLDIVLTLHERQVKMDYLLHARDLIVLYKELNEKLDTLSNSQVALKDMIAKHEACTASKMQRSIKEEYLFRANRYEISKLTDRVHKLKIAIAKIEDKIREYEDRELPTQFIKPFEQQVLEWHFANVEFATNTELANLDLKNWDKEEYAFDGEHLMASDGLACLPIRLAEGADVKLATVVRSIELTEKGVEVKAVNIDKLNTGNETKMLAKKLSSTPPISFQADAVLCTVPMGVLKNSVDAPETEDEERPPNAIQFIPPLPEAKKEAIRKLGYGNINKVVLIFEHIFWDKSLTLFGHVPETAAQRGLFFMFWAGSGQQPVMTAIVAGSAANTIELLEDEKIKEKCLKQLKHCFGKVAPLKNYYVTRWRADPWSMGCFTYCAVGSSGEDSDALAQAVCHPDDKAQAVPRLFFGGEHTKRDMIATVHGAFLSGTREAAKIADAFLEPTSV